MIACISNSYALILRRRIAKELRRAIIFLLLLFLTGSTIGYADVAATSSPATTTPIINEVLAANGHGQIDPDFHALSDWIELYNPSDQPVDLSGYFLTDDPAQAARWPIPYPTVIAPHGFLLFWADGQNQGNHTNFALDQDGETVALFSPSGARIDAVKFGTQLTDVSWARGAETVGEWRYYAEPTPGAANGGPSSTDPQQIAPPRFSLAGGFYAEPHWLTLTADPQAEIRVTFDGTMPTSQSALYVARLRLDANMVLRARTFMPDRLPSRPVTYSYFVGEEPSLPVISMSMDPAHLWSAQDGIYIDQEIERRKDWERPARIEWFDPDGTRGFAVDANVRLYGTSAFVYPQKSLAILAKSKLGSDAIDYRIFPNRDFTRYRSFVLRSSSDDWHLSLLRDAMMQALLESRTTVDLQAYRPVLLYINGRYFGIHNAREKYSEHYIASHYSVDAAAIDLVKEDFRQATVETTAGDLVRFQALMDLVRSQNPARPEVYAALQTQMDVANFIDYIAAQVYFANTSWDHNRRMWRTRDDDGRWRWMLFDLDRGFRDPEHDTLGRILAQDELFRSLWQSPRFRADFVRRFDEQLNTTFAPQRVIPILDSMAATLEPEMPHHIVRWKDQCWFSICGIQSLEAWRAELDVMRTFAHTRPNQARQQVVDHVRTAESTQMVPSIIDRDLHLTADHAPYLVRNRVTVLPDVTLTVDAGVDLLMAPAASIFISGAVHMAGQADRPVRVLPQTPNATWGAITIANTPHPSTMSNVFVQGGTRGEPAEPYRAGLNIIDAPVTMNHIQLAEMHGVALYLLRAHARLTNCHVIQRPGQTGNLIDVEYGHTLIDNCDITGDATCCINAVDLDHVESATVQNSRVRGFLGKDSDAVDVGTGSRNVLIHGNRIHGCGDKGISIGEDSRVTVTRNVITDCLMGVAVKDDSVALIENNTLHHNGIGINVYNLLQFYGGGHATVRNTIISASITETVRVDNRSTLTISYSLADSAQLPGTGNVRAAPGFVDPARGNFELTADSPAIDAGDPASPREGDGTIIDIGAHGYAPYRFYLPILVR